MLLSAGGVGTGIQVDFKCIFFLSIALQNQLISLEISITQLNDLSGNLNHLNNIIPESLERQAYVPSKILNINGFNSFFVFFKDTISVTPELKGWKETQLQKRTSLPPPHTTLPAPLHSRLV